MLGGTQPDKLDRLLVKTDDDGLLARFLTVYPDPVPLSRPVAKIDHERLQNALERLRNIPAAKCDSGSPRPAVVPFSVAAADMLQEFREQCRKWEAGSHGFLKGHIGKMPGLAVRLSCVLAHLDWAFDAEGAPPECIDVNHIARACHLVGEHYRLHAERAYGNAAPPQEIRNARRVAQIIMQERPRSLKVRDIQHRGLSGMQSAKPIEEAFSILEQADWVRRSIETTGGRSSLSYIVNPRLWRA